MVFEKVEDYRGARANKPMPPDKTDVSKKREADYYIQVGESLLADFASDATLIPFKWYNSRSIQELRDYATGRQSPDKIKKYILNEKRKTPDGRYITAMNISWEGYDKLAQMFDIMRSKNLNHEYDVDITCVDPESIAAQEQQRAALKFLVDENTKDFLSRASFKPEMEIDPNEIGLRNARQVDIFMDTGGYAHKWQIAAIAACHKTKMVSDYKEQQDLCMDDLIVNPMGITGMRTYIEKSTGLPKIRRVDVQRAIVPYYKGISSKGKISRAGEIIDMTMADIRDHAPHLTDSEIVYIAKKYTWNNEGYSRILDRVNSQGMSSVCDDISQMRVKVLDFEFLSTDIDRFIKNDRGLFKRCPSDYRITARDKKNGDKIVEKKVVRKYYAKWIIGTKILLDYGPVEDQVYYGPDGNKTPQIDFYFVNHGNKSLIERCVAIVDDMNMILVKHRNVWATLPAAPGMVIQKNLIENVFLNGKKQTPEGLLQAMIERGVLFYDALDDFGKPLHPAGGQKPIDYLNLSNIAALLSVCTAELQVKVNELREVLGLSQGADGGERSPYMGLGEQQLAIEQSNASLAPTFNAYRYLFKAVFDDVIKKWQIVAQKKKGIKLGYSALGNKNMRILELAKDFSAVDFNCEVTIGATHEDKMALLAELRELRLPPNGGVGITYAQYIYVRDRITSGNIKEAQAVMALFETQQREEARAVEERNIQANLEGQQESLRANIEGQKELQHMKGQTQLDTTKLSGLQKQIDTLTKLLLENKSPEQGANNTVNKQVAASLLGSAMEESDVLYDVASQPPVNNVEAEQMAMMQQDGLV